MDTSSYIVSFCIPCYNSADLVFRVVTQILKCKDERFQVVVSDSSSSDDTLKRLYSIKDTRLKICVTQPIPAEMNFLNALNCGDGEWLYLVMGRDLILADSIPKLIDLLNMISSKKDIAFVKDQATTQKKYDKIQYYDSKADALKRFIVDLSHPTGAIFRRDVFSKIPNKEIACKIFSVHAEVFWISKILENWKSCELPAIVNKKLGWAWGASIPRSTVSTNPNSLYWFPAQKTLFSIKVMDMLSKHSLTPAEHDMLFIAQWKGLMYSVSTELKDRFSGRKRRSTLLHYGLDPHMITNITKKEMCQNILQAYREVSHHYPHMSFRRKRKMLTAMEDKMCEISLNPYYNNFKIRLKSITKIRR